MKFKKGAIKHITLGEFEVEEGKPVIMKSGGHGQENINYLKKHKIKFNTAYEYKNGVRLGNVSIHRWERYRSKNKQSWFPKKWSHKDIRNAAKQVLSLKKSTKAKYPKTGYYKGVKVGLYAQEGKITTVFPWYTQKKKK